MMKRIDLAPTGHGVFGNPAPLGLLGLAVSCAALTPIAFGLTVSRQALLTAAAFSLFFGVICQLLTGLMEFANRNAFGGTIFTAFAFNWMITAVVLSGLAYGFVPDHQVIFATEVLLLIVFSVLTWGFGYFSSLLFFFLLDIDLIYVCKLIQGISGSHALDPIIATATVAMGLIGLWLALAGLMNPVVGRAVFPVGRPLFSAPRRPGFDFSVRRAIFDQLYLAWKTNGFSEMPIPELESRTHGTAAGRNILPDLHYLVEYGALKGTWADDVGGKLLAVRLSAEGIDLYEQLIYQKYNFGS